MRRPPRPILLLASLPLVLAACTGDDGVELGTAQVTAGEVVQTVVAPASIEPAGRVTVTAPLGGEIVELFVDDGDVVAAGDPLVRLASDGIDRQVQQAEAAVDAAEALAGAADVGVDLSPLLGAFASQMEALFPPLIDTLEDQLETLETAAEAAEVDAAPVTASREGLDRLAEAYEDARRQLRQAEAEARQQARQATAGQRAAAEAQRDQAALALEAARALVEDLTVVAPAGGVVELARADTGGVGTGGLEGFGDLGGAPDVGGLLGGGGTTGGPVAEGATVAPGQALLTIFDLSAFRARVAVDEIDVVDVEVGQAATVLVDAFPEAELAGEVARVALSPDRTATGGTSFPVVVDLVAVPDDVALRIGLTASAEIEVLRVEADTVVPTSALLRRGEDEVVYVVRDGIAVQTPVTVLAIGEDTAAVDGDVAAGDRVVTRGVELVQDGDEVPG